MHKLRFTALVSLYQDQESEARKRVGSLERERMTLVKKQDAVAASRVEAANATTTLMLHEQLGRYWQRTGEELRQITQSIARTDKELIDARNLLMQAHLRVATFEKLRERDARQVMANQEKRFTRELDEFAAQQDQNIDTIRAGRI